MRKCFERIPLNSADWPKWQCLERELPDLSKWTTHPPSEDEFAQFIDDVGCSNCLYDTFFASLPYILDAVEEAALPKQNAFMHELTFRMIQAAEQKTVKSLTLAQQLDASLPRIKRILIDLLDSDLPITSDEKKGHLSVLAICWGEVELGHDIAFLD